MKLSTCLSGDKLSSVEVGTITSTTEAKMTSSSQTKIWSSEKISKALKIILYLELIIFIGWFGCFLLSYPIADRNGHFTESETTTSTPEIRENEFTQIIAKNATDNETNPSINRGKRSIDENKREMCEGQWNETLAGTNELMKSLLIGEDSNFIVFILREEGKQRMKNMTLRVAMMKLIRTPSEQIVPSDVQWRELAVALREEVLSLAATDFSGLHETMTGPITPEITNRLRTIVESRIQYNVDCVDDVSSDKPVIFELLRKRDKCDKILTTYDENILPIVDRMIPENSTDLFAIKIRKELKENFSSPPVHRAASLFPMDPMTTFIDRLRNISSQDINKKIVETIKFIARTEDLERSEMFQQIGPLPTEIIEELRSVLIQHLRNIVDCQNLEDLVCGILLYGGNSESGTKRDCFGIMQRQ